MQKSIQQNVYSFATQFSESLLTQVSLVCGARPRGPSNGCHRAFPQTVLRQPGPIYFIQLFQKRSFPMNLIVLRLLTHVLNHSVAKSTHLIKDISWPYIQHLHIFTGNIKKKEKIISSTFRSLNDIVSQHFCIKGLHQKIHFLQIL